MDARRGCCRFVAPGAPIFWAWILLFAFLGSDLRAAEPVDIARAVVWIDAQESPRAEKAADLLAGEVQRRTGIAWRLVRSEPAPEAFRVVLRRGSAAAGGEPLAAEGYSIQSVATSPGEVVVTGPDDRGLLFGAGRLLRLLRMAPGTVTLPGPISIRSAPRYRLRGHQLGYRPKTNSYDGWPLSVWEQYIRDLAVFGTNAVELIPPRSDDDALSPHFPLPPLEMMSGVSKLCDAYGLDVWIWYPAMDPDYSLPSTVDAALREWGDVFAALPRVDAVFVPGGDPGHTRPAVLLAFLEKISAVLHRSHPEATLWVSPQGFHEEWLQEFLSILRDTPPAWLAGVVHGPQVRVSLKRLRELVPARFRMRSYPDITHTRQCQFPVPDWDRAFAATEGREPINPRPLGQAAIFRATQVDAADGFITYSEGCNDDVNKVIWSVLGWDPDADVVEALRDYGRYFFGDGAADSVAQAILGLERNWRGSLTANAEVYETLARWQAIERAASPRLRLSWRFQQGLYRAYYDAYIRARLLQETAAEERVDGALRDAHRRGSLAALDRAEAYLAGLAVDDVAREWRARTFELAEALFQSIRMQLSVERYGAIEVGRGANLDTIDAQLGDSRWLRARIDAARKLPDEPARLAAIEEIVHRADPGPGGFHDDLGSPGRAPHLVRGVGFEADPGSFESPRSGFADFAEAPAAWRDHAETLYDAPLELKYTGLDPSARYRVAVVYGGDGPTKRIRLETGPGVEVHGLIAKPRPLTRLEFDLPADAAATGGEKGELILRWRAEPGLGGNGRGCQVSEVWLLRK